MSHNPRIRKLDRRKMPVTLAREQAGVVKFRWLAEVTLADVGETSLYTVERKCRHLFFSTVIAVNEVTSYPGRGMHGERIVIFYEVPVLKNRVYFLGKKLCRQSRSSKKTRRKTVALQ